MFTAYLLINTQLGAELSVLEELKRLEGVEEAYKLWGSYAIIARIKAETMDKLKAIITKKVGANERITAKLTVLIKAVSDQPSLVMI